MVENGVEGPITGTLTASVPSSTPSGEAKEEAHVGKAPEGEIDDQHVNKKARVINEYSGYRLPTTGGTSPPAIDVLDATTGPR